MDRGAWWATDHGVTKSQATITIIIVEVVNGELFVL